MKDYLDRLPAQAKDLLQTASEVAALRNMKAYLVGGFVRDLILEVKNLDLDIVVEGDGIIFAEDLAALLKARLIRHRRFGTATVIVGHHLKIDVATARKEIYPSPASLPEVEFGSLKDDLKRRDFTINAMAVDISKDNYGSFVDLFGGKNDLKNKKIKVLHDLSFIDDPTRMLRAIRFEQRFGFKIEAKTLKLFKLAVKGKMLEKVEPQRIRDEIILILKENNPSLQLKRLKELTGFNFISKGFRLSESSIGLVNSAELEIRWFDLAHFRRRPLDIWLVYFMVMVDKLSPEITERICKKFVFKNGEIKRIESFKKISSKFVQELSSSGIKPSRIFALLEPLSYEVIIALKAKFKGYLFQRHLIDFLEIYNGMRVCISGEHLKNLGVKPGPEYKKIFSRVLQAKLNGQVNTEHEEINLIKKIITS